MSFRGIGSRSESGLELKSLTSLRWFAALAVFGWHIHRGGEFQSNPIMRLLEPGAAGVSLFFILSGFVMVWAARPGDTTKLFFIRRFARIYPSHVAAWLLSLIVAPFAPATFLLGLFLLQAWAPRYDVYFGMNGVAWSLSCEAFFYAIFPLLYRLLSPKPDKHLFVIAAVCVGVMAAVEAAALTFGNHDQMALQQGAWLWAAYVFPPTRALEFVIGCTVGLYVRRHKTFPVGPLPMVLLVVPLYLLTDLAPTTDVTAVVTVIPFALLIGALSVADLTGGTLLHARWLVLLGKWSFSFYLVHQLVLQEVVKHIHTYVAASTIGLLGSIGLAWSLHHLVEEPGNRLIRTRIRQRPLPLVVDEASV